MWRQQTVEPTRSVLRESTTGRRLMLESSATSQAVPGQIVSAGSGSGLRGADPDFDWWRKHESNGAGRAAGETWRCNRIRE